MGRSYSKISSLSTLFVALRISPSEEINSVYIRSAPYFLHTNLKGGSLTSSIGASNNGNSPSSIFPIFTTVNQFNSYTFAKVLNLNDPMFKALRPPGFFLVVIIYFLALFGMSIFASTRDFQPDLADQQSLFLFKLTQALGVLGVFILPSCIMVIFFSSQKLSYFLIHKAPTFRFILVSSLCVILALPLIR